MLNEKRVKTKWADYLISAVRFELGTNNSVGKYFKVWLDNIDCVDKSRTWSKEELLEALKNGKSIATIKQDADGKWIKGQDLSVYYMEGIFIRIDPNTIYGDQLGNIEEF